MLLSDPKNKLEGYGENEDIRKRISRDKTNGWARINGDLSFSVISCLLFLTV
jgi:hypothetical protein